MPESLRRRALRKFRGQRYAVVQREGVMGEGPELARYPYFSKDGAVRLANMVNATTKNTHCLIEKVPRD